MSFDLNDAVGDAAWSPHCATTFAAVTDDGRVHVYDLAQNKLMPLCSQKVRGAGRARRWWGQSLSITLHQASAGSRYVLALQCHFPEGAQAQPR